MGRENRASERDNVFKPIIASDFIFSLKCIKTFLWPGSAQTRRGSLSAPGTLAAVDAMEGNTLAAIRGALRRRKGGVKVRWKDRR